MTGKAPIEDLEERVFPRVGATDASVRLGPAVGEDAAAIALGDTTLVVSTDPVSLAAEAVGRLAVQVACNDVAATGADPRWLLATLLVPTGDGDALETVAGDLGAAASDAGVAIAGGHTEYVDALERPIVVLTAMGECDRVVETGGARPGDRLLLTKAAGLEGTTILAADFGEDLAVDPETRDRARAYRTGLSVVPDARAVRRYATAMHDPTEGGVLAGAVELALAAGVRVDLDREAVPVRPETATLCAAADVDPLRIFGSGALLVAVGDEDVTDAVAALEDASVPVSEVGTVREAGSSPGAAIGGEWLTSPPPDDLARLWVGG